MDFSTWETLAANVDKLKEVGVPILRAQQQMVETMCRNARWLDVGDHRVPVVNAPIYYSDVGQRLLEMYPEAPFSAYYFDRNDGLRQWGLRSRDGFDCSEVARQLGNGGGGHPQAAGFTEPISGDLALEPKLA